MIRTSVNVTGDATVACVVAKSEILLMKWCLIKRKFDKIRLNFSE
jgi:Na+/H+-dicarboxylate symporter